MKSTVISILAAVGVAAAAFFGMKQSNTDQSVRDALIEAMTQDEGYIVDRIDCRSEAFYNPPHTYTDCSTCTTVKGYEGQGNFNKCSVIRQVP